MSFQDLAYAITMPRADSGLLIQVGTETFDGKNKNNPIEREQQFYEEGGPNRILYPKRKPTEKCKMCKEETSTTCKRCKRIYYCNNKCAKADWKNHKQECKKFLNLDRIIHQVENRSIYT